MDPQPTFSDLEYMTSGRTTRRQEFLDDLERLVPWAEWVALVRTAYDDSPGRRGRPAVGAEVMLRAYLVQNAFGLSDVATEEAIVDSRAIGAFVGRGVSAPDSTTICKFRHAIEAKGIGRKMFEELVALLDAKGLIMHRGSVVDATFIEAPSSTKNKRGERDPEAHQAKKGNNWHFGYKAHAGADAETGIVHTLATTAANVADVTRAASLVRPDDEHAWADAGYAGVERRDGAEGLEWHVAAKRSTVTDETRARERAISSARSVVEHPFHVVKDIFGHRKTRYRGLAKNDNQLCVLFALGNLLLLKRGRRAFGPPAVLSAKSLEEANRRAAERAKRQAEKKAARKRGEAAAVPA